MVIGTLPIAIGMTLRGPNVTLPMAIGMSLLSESEWPEFKNDQNAQVKYLLPYR